MAAIADHQVVIVAGETGSGKTTQIPKMCLELGRGRDKVIGHTQPRRIAARSVAERIAEELGSSVNDPASPVGYKIRFDDRVSRHTAVKLMTDGVLLNEIQRDALLRGYDTIIIDEAHERSLNIDFLLGYLKRLLPRRPDLKLIITSATIDPESFAQHFCDGDGNPAPIIEVSGRTFPVEIRYRPLTREVVDPATGEVTEEDTDPLDGLIAACDELTRAGDGDILCFFSGEREIRDAAEALESHFSSGGRTKGRGGAPSRGSTARPRATGGGQAPGGTRVDILPLFGRLSNQEQHRVFHPGGRRRIVLATNIAETSLTVPGIRYVVDTGYARISRYSHRTKVQRLPVEEISQASARQRSGRCGRVADGIAIRLYSEENFAARPEFTDPEILRTHLASVILSMTALGLGDIAEFPFLQPPDAKSIRDGVALLVELGAITTSSSGPALTDVGRDLARIPTDPRLARMLAAGHEAQVLAQLAIIVANLSIQDVRERPLEQQEKADAAHARFATGSDFLSILSLWSYLQTQRRELSGNQFRRLCREEFLHYVRILEWMDLVRQFLTIAQELGWEIPNVAHVHDLIYEPEDLSAASDAVHKSVLTGVVGHIGMREGTTRQYVGPRQSRFVIHPSSQLSKKPPQWIMAAELVETSQIFARTVGPIQPEWVEELAPHMVKRVHSEPHWSSSRGSAMVHEKVLMLGLPIVADRTIPLGRVDRVLARELFIRHALVQGEWTTRHQFFAHNQRLLEEATELEDKARRRGIVIDDDALFDFYDRRLPASILSARHFDSWWKKARHADAHQLDFSLDAIIASDSAARAAAEFPDTWVQGTLEFPLEYIFEPGHPRDGVTLRAPLPLLANVDPEHAQWLVPGMRKELCVALIRSLPKPLRVSVVPAAQFADAALERMVAFEGPITTALADALRALGGRGIDADDFDVTRIPDHLRMTVAAIDRRGNIVDSDRDIPALVARRTREINQAIAAASARGLRGASAPGVKGNSNSPAPRPDDAALNAGPSASRRRSSGGRTRGGASRDAAAGAGSTETRAHSGARGPGGSGLGGVLARARTWDLDGLGELPEHVETIVDGQKILAYPAIVADSSGMSVVAFPTERAAQAQQFKTVLECMVAAVSVSPQQMVKGLPLRQRVAVESYPGGGPQALIDDAIAVAARNLLMAQGPVVRTPVEFDRLRALAPQRVPGEVRQMVVAVAPALLAVADIREELQRWSGDVIDSIRHQVDFYLPEHALARHGVENLRHVPRYTEAIKMRLDALERQPDRDAEAARQVQQSLDLYEATLRRVSSRREASPQLREIRWMIEELRVSLFAQSLGTARTVSTTRIAKALGKIRS